MIDIEDLEKKFITEYSSASQIEAAVENESEAQKISDKELENCEEVYEDQDFDDETFAAPEEEAPEDFQKFSIPLFDKNAWDDSALIRAWDESIRQRDKPLQTPVSNEAPVCKVKVSRVQVDEDFGEVRAPTYDRHSKPQIASKRSHTSNQEKNETKKSRKANNNEKCTEQYQSATWEEDAQPSTTTAAQYQSMPFVPPPSMLPSHDEDLNNLVNAWYFAGYYSAVYQMKNRGNQ